MTTNRTLMPWLGLGALALLALAPGVASSPMGACATVPPTLPPPWLEDSQVFPEDPQLPPFPPEGVQQHRVCAIVDPDDYVRFVGGIRVGDGGECSGLVDTGCHGKIPTDGGYEHQPCHAWVYAGSTCLNVPADGGECSGLVDVDCSGAVPTGSGSERRHCGAWVYQGTACLDPV